MQDQEGFSKAQVGSPAPDFLATKLTGEEVNLGSFLGPNKVLLVFYRGGWCPFCNAQLGALSQDYSKFEELNTKIVAVSGEEIEKGKDFLKKIGSPFTLLSDTGFRAIDLYGVRDPSSPEALKAKGIKSLAKPSSFIIDERGIIRYKYVGKNATDRPKVGELLRVLKQIDEGS